MSNPTHLRQVMTRSQAQELVSIIRRLTGDDIEERAVAILGGWPLGKGPTMAAECEAARRQQRGLING